jgi:hypothetical protein
MLNTVLVVALAGGLPSQLTRYPDQIDILRGADTTPQIELVLDTSGSMTWPCSPTVCGYYFNTINNSCGGGAFSLRKIDMLKASLTGCTSTGDGVLDKWDNRVLFAIREFGGSRGTASDPGLRASFDITFSNHTALENAVLALPASGGTPLAGAYLLAGQHMSGFWDANNSFSCRQNYIVLMTDGEGNSGLSFTADFISGNPSLTFRDTASCYPAGCGANYSPPFSDEFAAYMFDNNTGTAIDAIPGVPNIYNDPVTGVALTTPILQPIRTYTIGFQTTSNGQSFMQAVAARGDGTYYDATSYQQLDTAFNDIITDVVERSNVTFSASSVQTDGIFSGNYVYTSAFKPALQGRWQGTIRKYCVLPPASNPADDTCIFYYPGGSVANPLLTNPNARDIWTGRRGQEVTNSVITGLGGGGSAQQIWNQLFNVTAVTDPPPATNPLGRRQIYTWRNGQVGYVRVDGAGVSSYDTWTNTLCEHYSLLNKLHGYTYAVADCPNANYNPQALEISPQGDTINGGTAVLKYTATCETGSDRCYVATVANDGMLHFFDAVSGVETSAIVPATAWWPNKISNHNLSAIQNQPSLQNSRRYYFDGHIRLFHDDNGGGVAGRAGNGIIDANEPAHLIAPLGRGGAAYISFPVTTFNGIPDPTRNPPRPLYPDEATGFEHLQDTWAAPYIGRFRYQGQDRAVAVFSNGHRRQEDPPLAQIGAVLGGSKRTGELLDNRSNPITHSCDTAYSNPNWTGVSQAVCHPMAAAGLPELPCTAEVNGCSYASFTSPCCYDAAGWATLAPAPWNFSTTGGQGHSIILGPFNWTSGNSDQIGVSYRVGFDRFFLQPGDYISILDSRQQEVGRLVGNGTDQAAAAPGGVLYTPWVVDSSFYLRFRSNGVDDANSFLAPFNIREFQHVRRAQQSPNGQRSYPTIYVVDINRWNGPNTDGSGGQGFSDPPTNGGDTRQNQALLARISSRCTGQVGPNETCIDGTTSANTADLQHMVCGVSSELAVYTEGDLLRSIYFMDRCGQIFKVDYNLRNLANPWSARRLLNVNNLQGSGRPIVGNSKDYRQGMTQLELVLTQCNGARSIGVYFGTGNMQRPAEFDNLQSGTIASHTNNEHTFTSLAPSAPVRQWADVIGVVFDSPSLPVGANLNSLMNVTDQLELTNTSGINGFFIELRQNEKLLRKPLVLEGVAFFKTYQPVTPATECVSAEGIENFYVFNSCTARPLVDGSDLDGGITNASDRVAASNASDIGGEILAVFPKSGEPIVSPADFSGGRAELPKNPTTRGLKMFMWRKIE